MKYIVVWALLINKEIHKISKPDNFGHTTEVIELTLSLDPEPHAKVFYDKDCAMKFYQQCSDKLHNPDITNVSIDSTVSERGN